MDHWLKKDWKTTCSAHNYTSSVSKNARSMKLIYHSCIMHWKNPFQRNNNKNLLKYLKG